MLGNQHVSNRNIPILLGFRTLSEDSSHGWFRSPGAPSSWLPGIGHAWWATCQYPMPYLTFFSAFLSPMNRKTGGGQMNHVTLDCCEHLAQISHLTGHLLVESWAVVPQQRLGSCRFASWFGWRSGCIAAAFTSKVLWSWDVAISLALKTSILNHKSSL